MSASSEHPTSIEAELVRLHAPSFAWALSCCAGDREDAEEVLHEVYASVLDGRARFRGESRFQTWLFAVIRRLAAAERRRKVLSRLYLLRYSERGERAAPVLRPDEALHRAQVRELLREALARLPGRQREAVVLVFYHEMTLAEAARVMGVGIGSARTHYERAKRQIREWIERRGCTHEIGPERAGMASIVS